MDGGRVAILPGQVSDEHARVLAGLLRCDLYQARQRLSRPGPDVHRFASRDEATQFARALQDAGLAVVAYAEAALARALPPRLTTSITCVDPAIPPYPPRAALQITTDDSALEVAASDLQLVVIGRAFTERLIPRAPTHRPGATLQAAGAFAGGAVGALVELAGASIGGMLEGNNNIRSRTSELTVDLHGPAPLPVRLRENLTAVIGPGFPAARSAEVTLRALLKWLTYIRASLPPLPIDDSYEIAATRRKAIDPRSPLTFDEHSAEQAIISALVKRRRPG